jgi:hypothetical protein
MDSERDVPSFCDETLTHIALINTARLLDEEHE